MTLLGAWALAGLALSVPIVLLHLRRRRPPVHEVSSLLAWRQLPTEASSSSRRLGWPVLPLLLALQLLALAALVLALARPASALRRPSSTHIYVVDTSFWMQARQGGVQRMATARSILRAQLRRLPRSSHVEIVTAGPAPAVVFSGRPRAGERAAVGLRAGDGQGDLGAALALASGLRGRSGDPIVLLRAAQDPLGKVLAGGSDFTDTVVDAGRSLQDLGLTDVQARCGLPRAQPCEIFARVFNTGSTARDARVRVIEGARTASHKTVRVGRGSSAPVAFQAPAGLSLQLSIAQSDALASDNDAFVVVPSAKPVRITIVARAGAAHALTSALEATPEVQPRILTPSTYRSADAGTSDLLVLDGWLPPGGLPRAPALLLVDPPRLPGGRVSATLTDSRLSGSDSVGGLLAGVDLTSLAIASHQARRLTLPPWMTAVAWSPEGPLLAAGSSQAQRVAVLAFDPSVSDLPQLSTFPLLVSNLIAWSQEWTPTQLQAGEALAVQEPPGTISTTVSEGVGGRRLAVGSELPRLLELPRPGLYTIDQRGPWGTRAQTVAVNVGSAPAAPAGAAIQLSGPPAAGGARRAAWWPWPLAAALVLLVLEWAYAARREVRLATS